MAKGIYWQRGESLDFVNSTQNKIENGDVVVIGTHIGIAGDDIPAGGTGTVHVTGVFKLPKAASDGGISVGAAVVWDSTNGVIAAYDASASSGAGNGDVIGYAVSAAATADTVAAVKLNG